MTIRAERRSHSQRIFAKRCTEERLNTRNRRTDELVPGQVEELARKRINCGSMNRCPCCTRLRAREGNGKDGKKQHEIVSGMKMKEGMLENDSACTHWD